MDKEYEPINFTYYNPKESIFKAGRHEREKYTVYSCCNKENCDAYKCGMCLMLNWSAYGFHKCPYGKLHTNVGLTKAAKCCGDMISMAREQYKDVEYALKGLRHVCRIGDYVYLNLPHLYNYINPIRQRDFFVDDDTIKSEDFTPEFIVELIKFRPCALMGGEIRSYQKLSVPEFCDQLKRHMPEMFQEVKKIYPEIEGFVEDIDYRGKDAKVKTLLPGTVKLGSNIAQWDGEVIRMQGNQLMFCHLNNEEVVIIPNDSTCVTVANNKTVTNETEFKDG